MSPLFPTRMCMAACGRISFSQMLVPPTNIVDHEDSVCNGLLPAPNQPEVQRTNAGRGIPSIIYTMDGWEHEAPMYNQHLLKIEHTVAEYQAILQEKSNA